MGHTITAADLKSLPMGSMLTSRRDGTLIQPAGKNEIYVLGKGMKRLVPDNETFTAMPLSRNLVQRIVTAEFALIPLGPALITFK